MAKRDAALVAESRLQSSLANAPIVRQKGQRREQLDTGL
jgi:hypothetical protein